jgi:hypothetical protein
LLEQCPLAFIGDGVDAVMEAAEFAEKGLLPGGRGWLEEPQGLVDAIRFVWREERAAKIRRKIEDMS